MQNDDMQELIAKIDKDMAESKKSIDEAAQKVAEIDLKYAKAVVECDIRTLEAIESIQNKEEE